MSSRPAPASSGFSFAAPTQSSAKKASPANKPVYKMKTGKLPEFKFDDRSIFVAKKAASDEANAKVFTFSAEAKKHVGYKPYTGRYVDEINHPRP